MNDKSGRHRPRPARLGWLGVLLAILGIVALAACSSTPATASGDSSTSSAYQKALAYAQCIRAHGAPDFPDPNSKGQFIAPNGSSLPSVSPAVLQSSGKACQKLLPPSMAQGPPQGPQGTAATNQGLKFSECMRNHGEPNFPDPAANGSITLPSGMNAESPQFQAAEKACKSLMPNNPSGQGAS
jgi:hypothetical protein